MSTKRPDVLVQPPSPLTALTLAEIHVHRWKLTARCNKCPTALKVNVGTLMRVHGPDTVWWGALPPCPGIECDDGRLVYSAQAIRGGTWVTMRHAPAANVLEAWKQRQGWIRKAPR